MLIARNLSKSYGQTRVLSSLDLEIPAEEVFCLLGHNGAGKSTTLRLFMGVEQPTTGETSVAGVVAQRDPVAARLHLSYVPEQVQLYPELTGLENLAYFAGLAGVQRYDRAELTQLLEECGLPREAAAQPASKYSKGMRQKVVLALSRAKQAQALLLDEPTSGLDPQAVRDLCVSIRKESQRGAAILMVTHDFAAVADVAHRIGVLCAGRLVHVSPVDGSSEADIASTYRMAIEMASPQPSRPQRSGAEALGRGEAAP